MNEPDLERLQALYHASLIVNADQNKIRVESDRWAQAEELRRSLNLPLNASLLNFQLNDLPAWIRHPHVLLQHLHPETWAQTARRFACDCAQRVLSDYEGLYPGDSRLLEGLRVARAYTDDPEAAALASAQSRLAAAAEDAAVSAAVQAPHYATTDAAYARRAAVVACWSVLACCNLNAQLCSARAAYESARATSYRSGVSNRSQVFKAERRWQQTHLILLATRSTNP